MQHRMGNRLQRWGWALSESYQSFLEGVVAPSWIGGTVLGQQVMEKLSLPSDVRGDLLLRVVVELDLQLPEGKGAEKGRKRGEEEARLLQLLEQLEGQ